LLHYFFFQAEDGIRDLIVTGVQTCALPIYNKETMFAKPEYVFKDGEQIVHNGRVIKQVYGATHVVHPEFDSAIETDLDAYFDRYMTTRKESLKVSDDELRDGGLGDLVVHSTTVSDA